MNNDYIQNRCNQNSSMESDSIQDGYRIMIIEDDPHMADEVAHLLGGWGYEVALAKDFSKILEETVAVKPQAILLDINLPCFDGFYWCKKLREITKVPIIFLSSRDSSMDIVMAINNGGDDYMQKPFDDNVLIAKLQAVLRRTYEIGHAEQNVIRYKQMYLNIEEMSLSYKDQTMDLTKNEFKILKLLLARQGKVVSRNELMKGLWDEEIYVNENTLTVNVNRLRGKLEEIGLSDVIYTKKGVGYWVE